MTELPEDIRTFLQDLADRKYSDQAITDRSKGLLSKHKPKTLADYGQGVKWIMSYTEPDGTIWAKYDMDEHAIEIHEDGSYGLAGDCRSVPWPDPADVPLPDVGNAQ